MPIFGRQSSTWYTATAPNLYARQSGIWYGASYIFGRQSGTWYGTDYAGRPNSPQVAGGWSGIIGSAADNFSQVSLGYWGPSGGTAPSGFIHRMFNNTAKPNDSVTGLLAKIGPGDPGYSAGTCTFNVSPDTAYVFRVYSVNVAGESTGYLEARYAIGHGQQTYQQANYGWGAEYDVKSAVTDWSSDSGGQYGPNSATDWPASNWPTTIWLSAARASSNYAEALRLLPWGTKPDGSTVPGDAQLTAVRIWPSYGLRLWVGINQNNTATWFGNTGGLDSPSQWINYPAFAMFAHPYCHVTGIGVPANQEHQYRPADEGIDSRQNNITVDIAVDQLQTVPGKSGVYAALVEVIFRFRSWEIVSYSTVTSVSQQNNYYW